MGLILASLCVAGCAVVNPNRRAFVPAGSVDKVRIAFDSRTVRDLINEAAKQQTEIDRFWFAPHTAGEGARRVGDMSKHPELYPPARNEFREALERFPGATLHEKTFCRIIGAANVRCAFPITMNSLLHIRITSGPLTGREGWVCDTHVSRLLELAP